MVTDQLHWRRASHFALTIGAVLALLAVNAAPGTAKGDAEQQGAQLLQSLQAGEQKCQQLSRDQSESVGEYVMGRMLGSTTRHEAMDQRMRTMTGASGEAQAHVFMGQRFTGCATGAAPGAFGSMMGMMSNYSGARGGVMGNGRDGGNSIGNGNGMMGGSDSRSDDDNDWGSTNTVLVILLAAMAAALAALAARRPWQQSSLQTPFDILSDRYARGDIDTADYEQRRSALKGPA